MYAVLFVFTRQFRTATLLHAHALYFVSSINSHRHTMHPFYDATGYMIDMVYGVCSLVDLNGPLGVSCLVRMVQF